MFSVHNLNSNNLSIKNLILLFLTIVMGFASVITLAQITIPSSIDNAHQTIGRVTITSDGTASGTEYRDINYDGIWNTRISNLSDAGNFSGKVLVLNDNNTLMYATTDHLVVSWSTGGGGGGTGDGHRTGDNLSDIRNLNAGNVGIGAAPTSGKLHIVSSWETDVYIEELAADKAANINFKNTARTWTVGGDSFPDIFYIGIPGLNQFLSIIPTGEVGIGTTGPKAPLQVIGNFIAGDYSNNIIGTHSSIGWGSGNGITWNLSFVWWGLGNTVTGKQASIVGGAYNQINGTWSFIGWGGEIKAENKIYGDYSSVVWGITNKIITSNYSFIWWWYGNKIYDSIKAFIGWGDSNIITWKSDFSTIPGWFTNGINNAKYSFAAGVNAKANSNNSFVRNSDTTTDFISIKTWTFIVNVPWGSRPDMWWMGINTNDPQALLDVNGTSVIRGSLNALWGINSTDIIASGKLKAEKTELEIWSSAVTSWGSCGSENPGTIIYDGVGFYGCGPSNTRKRLD